MTGAHPAAAAGTTPASVLFVCMGNICRSPTAEVVLRDHLLRGGRATGLRVASAGIGDWHVGEPPDPRAIAHARRRGYELAGLRARQISRDDFARFRWILAMDRHNLHDLEALRPPGFSGHLGLALDLVPGLGTREVPDPYYGGAAGFEAVLDLLERAAPVLAQRVLPGGSAR